MRLRRFWALGLLAISLAGSTAAGIALQDPSTPQRPAAAASVAPVDDRAAYAQPASRDYDREDELQLKRHRALTPVPSPSPTQTSQQPPAPYHSCNQMKHSIWQMQGQCPARPSKAEIQALEREVLAAWGWSAQFSCLDKIIELEDNWNIYDENSLHAYGLPQALPGSKMASAGADWGTNPRTQLKWMLGYIKGRYGSPCNALSVRQSRSPTWY